MYKNPYEIRLCYLISVSLKEHRRSQGLASWYKVRLNYLIKHTCIFDFVWYNMYEDGRECTDSTPPSQSVPLSPSGIPTPLSPFIFTLSQKKAARKPPFSCVQTDECATMAAGVLR